MSEDDITKLKKELSDWKRERRENRHFQPNKKKSSSLFGRMLPWLIFAVLIFFVQWNDKKSETRTETALIKTSEALAETPLVKRDVEEIQSEVKMLNTSVRSLDGIEDEIAHLNGSVTKLNEIVNETLDKLSDIKYSSDLMGLLTKSGIGVITATREGKIDMWSTAATKVFGYARMEARGRPIEDLMVEENRERHRIIFQNGINDTSPYAHMIVCNTAQHKDGTVFDIQLVVISPPEANWVCAIFWDLPPDTPPYRFSSKKPIPKPVPEPESNQDAVARAILKLLEGEILRAEPVAPSN